VRRFAALVGSLELALGVVVRSSVRHRARAIAGFENRDKDFMTDQRSVTRVYFDALSLLNDRLLLDESHPDFALFVTRSVRKDLDDPSSSDPRSHDASKKLAEAIDARRVTYLPFDTSNTGKLTEVYHPQADVLIHALLSSSRADHSDVLVVVQDRNLAEDASKAAIPAVTAEGFRGLIGEAVRRDSDARRATEQAAAKAAEKHRKRLVGSVLGGLVAGALGFLAARNLDRVVANISVWGTCALILGAGLALYAVRGRFRVGYGVGEFVIGSLATINVFFPTFDYQGLNRAAWLQVLAGLYVMVRGLDNVGKGLEGSSSAAIWRLYSGEQ
jgi:hypothetical protein